LVSLNVGLPRDVSWRGRTVHTGIWKTPVTGSRLVRRLNVDGDGQGDLLGHGGEQRAVLVYQVGSYDYWRHHFGRNDIEFGAFGDNFTVDGLPDDEVCIGDRYRIGGAQFEVTQPRVTCYRVGMRLGVPDLAALLVAHHRPGFYLRVLSEGRVEAGAEIEQIAQGPQRMTVAEIDALLYLPDRDADGLRRALLIPALSPGWQGSFRELLDAANSAGRQGAPLMDTEPAWAGFRPLQVQSVIAESTSILSITLADRHGTPLPRAQAGQYLTLRLSGAGEPAPVRNYSLSSAPGSAQYRISVKRETPGLVSGYLHTSVSVGTLIDVAAPRGTFVLRAGTTPVVLISAGVGVTPALAMLHQLADADRAREVWWLHAARNPAEQAFAAEARRLLTGLDRGHELLFYSGVSPAEAEQAGGRAGRLTPEVLAGLGLPPTAAVYLCGPAGFMVDVREALSSLGFAEVYTELFGPLDAINPGVVGEPPVAPHPPAGPPPVGPPVTFARSSLTVPFDGHTGQSLLELAEACDVPTRWSCRTGVCHTCETPILSGEISYDPAPLELPPAGVVLICCARPTSPVILEM
jgi:ferredoxin-NADP reductase/MOSC domain-containing protein YiiM